MSFNAALLYISALILFIEVDIYFDFPIPADTPRVDFIYGRRAGLCNISEAAAYAFSLA